MIPFLSFTTDFYGPTCCYILIFIFGSYSKCITIMTPCSKWSTFIQIKVAQRAKKFSLFLVCFWVVLPKMQHVHQTVFPWNCCLITHTQIDFLGSGIFFRSNKKPWARPKSWVTVTGQDRIKLYYTVHTILSVMNDVRFSLHNGENTEF